MPRTADLALQAHAPGPVRFGAEAIDHRESHASDRRAPDRRRQRRGASAARARHQLFTAWSTNGSASAMRPNLRRIRARCSGPSAASRLRDDQRVERRKGAGPDRGIGRNPGLSRTAGGSRRLASGADGLSNANSTDVLSFDRSASASCSNRASIGANAAGTLFDQPQRKLHVAGADRLRYGLLATDWFAALVSTSCANSCAERP